MTKAKTFLRGFSGGIVGADLLGRIEQPRWQTGAQDITNMVCKPQGPVQTRPAWLHTAMAARQDKRGRLASFSLGNGEALVVEAQEGSFRFYSRGKPVAFAQVRAVSAVVGDELHFEQQHGFGTGEQVRVLSMGGTLPTPLTHLASYTANVLDSRRIDVGQTLSDAGVAPIIVVPEAQMPRAYVSSKNFTVTIGTQDVTFAIPHGLQVNDPIITTSDGTIPSPLLNGGVYYVVQVPSPTVVLISNVYGGTPTIPFGTTGSGTHRVHFLYELGDLVHLTTSGQGFYYCNQRDPRDNTPTGGLPYWHRLPDDGSFEVPNPYLEVDLPSLNPRQSGEVLTFPHPGYTPGALTRISSSVWTFEFPQLVPTLAAPTGLQAAVTRGARIRPLQYLSNRSNLPTNVLVLDVRAGHGLATGETVYAEGFASQLSELPDDFYTITLEEGTVGQHQFALRKLDGELINHGSAVAATNLTGPPWGTVEIAGQQHDRTSTYKVTAVDSRGIESQPSAEIVVTNNLLIAGTKNALTWNAVTGAVAYHVYKERDGIFGRIGESESASFEERSPGVAPNPSKSVPLIDDQIATLKPRTVCGFENRRFFAGAESAPARWIASRTDAPTDFSYHRLPADTDRLSYDLETDDRVTIRHVVPVAGRLLFLSTGAEVLLQATQDEALTAKSASARQVSNEGASTVPPLVFDSTVVFVSAKTQHLMAARLDGTAYRLLDLCLFVPDLFIGYTITQLAASKSPVPVVWALRDDGVVLACTYVPGEEVAAFSILTADGVVESIQAVDEAGESRLYALVNRAGARSLVRADRLEVASTYVDGTLYDGRNDGAVTVTLTSPTWTSEPVSVTGSSPILSDLDAQEGAELIVRAGGQSVRLRMLTATTARALGTVPVSLRGVAVTSWEIARKHLVRSELASRTVTVRADDQVRTVTVGADGVLSLPAAASVIAAGAAFTQRLKPLPPLLQSAENLGFGSSKSIDEIVVRAAAEAPFLIQSGDRSVEAESGRTPVPGTWDDEGDTFELVQDRPFGLKVVSMAVRVTVGG